jgi:hypothetical protein
MRSLGRRRGGPETRGAEETPVIFRWDLDKTYLRSEFERWRDLVRIPFEKPEDKVTVPGVVPLIRGLREVAAGTGREARIYFISASPPQIAKAIKAKLALDGIAPDGIVFKDQLHHLVRGKLRNLREQVGFKLTELLKSRAEMPAHAREVLFGDDWESDPVIYSLFADLLAGRVPPETLEEILRTIGVDPELIAQARTLAASIEPEAVVTRIYINLERRTPPTSFRHFGARLVPAFNYFQTAACLFEDGYLTLPAVAAVAESLIADSRYNGARLLNSLADVARRGHLHETSAIAVREYLAARGVLPAPGRPREHRASLWRRLRAWFRSRPPTAPSPEPRIDYHQLVAAWRPR